MKDQTTDAAKYPLFSLPSCLNVGEAVRDAGGGNSDVPKSLIASQLKVDEKAAILSQRIGAAKSFGLIDGRGAYRLTDLAKSYFFPQSEHAKRKAALSMLASPNVFGALVRRFDGSKLPPLQMLGNVIHTEFGVPESWKDRVAGFFLKSAAFSGALDAQGFLRYGAGQHTMTSPNPSNVPPNMQSEKEEKLETGTSSGAPNPLGRDITAWSSNFKGASVRVEATGDLPLPLWEKLNAYVQVLKPLEDSA